MRKLLYVEDNEDNLYMPQLRFDVLGGYQVLSDRDGAAGIAMAVSERRDLILMDLDLPEIDGREVVRRLKADPATRDIPIIALSALAMAGDQERRSPPVAMISTSSPSNSIACSPRSSSPRPPKGANQPQSREPGG
jgi:CheY-like chemotaxis protein